MRIITTREITSTVSAYKIHCDLCGILISHQNPNYTSIDGHVEIQRFHWSDVGDGYKDEVERVDFCYKCFDTKFKNWLTAQGVTVTKETL